MRLLVVLCGATPASIEISSHGLISLQIMD